MNASLFACSFASLLILTALPAQDAAPTLPEVLVTARPPDPSRTVPTLETRRQELVASTPGGVAVVDAEDYKRGRSTTLKDALDFAPGVFIQPRFGAEESRVSIRGSGIQRTFHGRGIKLMQDGSPLNLADGGFDMQAIEPLSARYIEVFRGANALQFGSTTLGGAINFVSLTGHEAALLQSRFEAGSFGSYRGQLSSGGVFGASDVYASYSYSETDGYRDHARQDSRRFFANFGQRLGENLETRFYVTHVTTDSQLPGSLTRRQLERRPDMANPGNVRFNQKRDFELFRLANRTVWSDDMHRLTLSTFWSWKDLDHPLISFGPGFRLGPGVIDQLSNDLGLDLRYDSLADLSGHRNQFTLGLGYAYGLTQDNRFANVLGRRGGRTAQNQLSAANLDLYVQDSFHLTDSLAMVLGAQGSYADRDLDEQRRFGADNSDRQEYWGFSPKFGLLWDAAPEVQFFANVSRSFEPPSFGELTALGGTPGLIDLKAQRGTSLELGTRGSRGRARWDVAWYYTWLDNELFALGVPGVSATQTVNAGRTIRHGVEALLDVDVVRGLFTAAGELPAGEAPAGDRVFLRQFYLFNDFHFDGDPVFANNELPGIPRHFYRAELLYEHPCGFYAGPNVEWAPQSYFVDLANTLEAEGYALLGFKVGYRTKKGLSFFVEAKNLTDETYAATTGVVTTATPASAVFFPGDGRSLFAGIEWKW